MPVGVADAAQPGLDIRAGAIPAKTKASTLITIVLN
jgi:hypothetical protein